MSLRQLPSSNRDLVRAMQRTADAVRDPSRTFYDLIADSAATHADRVAILDTGSTISYAQLARRCAQYARLFLEQNLHKGDCVALLMPNSGDYLAAWTGISAVGGVAALINTSLRGEALAHAVSTVGPRVAIVHVDLLENYLSACRQLAVQPTLLVAGGRSGEAPSIEDALVSTSDAILDAHERQQTTLSDGALYIFTSGTTGLPKAARVGHRRVVEWSTWFAGMLDTTPNDRMYDCLPMYHSVGGIVAPGAVLSVGGSVVLRPKFSASQFWNEISTLECTLFQYIGELCRYLVSSPPHARERQHRLRIACGNGLRADIWERFAARFAIPRVIEFYAATEGSFSLYNIDGRPGAIGRLTGLALKRPPVEIVRFDAETEQPIRGADGLCIRCDHDEPGEALGRIDSDGKGHRFEGYTSDADSSRKLVRDVFARGDCWFRTGDLMRRDAAGYIYFVDRIGDTFRWKGENVSTLEVSNALCRYPGIENAVVYGVEVPGNDGRAGMAALQVTPAFTLEGLHAFLAGMLPPYALPLFLRIVQSLDTTETFKPRKNQLVQDGYDPDVVREPLYAWDAASGNYVAFSSSARACAIVARAYSASRSSDALEIG